MTAANNPTRVVAVGESSSTQDQIVNALGSSTQSDFELVDVIVPSENLVRDVRTADPKLIIIDYQTGEQSILDIIDDLTLQVEEGGATLEVGQTIRVRDEIMQIAGIERTVLTVARAVQDSEAVPHIAGEEIFTGDRVSLIEFFTHTEWNPQIGDFGIIPLYENWRPGEFEVATHTTAEDVEKMVRESVPGGGVDFIPAGMTHWLAVMRPFSSLSKNLA